MREIGFIFFYYSKKVQICQKCWTKKILKKLNYVALKMSFVLHSLFDSCVLYWSRKVKGIMPRSQSKPNLPVAVYSIPPCPFGRSHTGRLTCQFLMLPLQTFIPAAPFCAVTNSINVIYVVTDPCSAPHQREVSAARPALTLAWSRTFAQLQGKPRTVLVCLCHALKNRNFKELNLLPWNVFDWCG